MMMPVDRAPAPRRLKAAPETVRAKAPSARWVPGLLTASMAIILAVRQQPPPGLDKSAYFLALLLIFIAGMAGVMAAVQAVPGDPRGRRAAGSSKLVYYSSVVALAVAVSLSVASLL
ncbi:unnamed protein product [Urochloa humidicola]